MNVAEAAKYLEVSESLVYKLCKRGLIAHHRVGIGRGTVRIDVEQLRAYKDLCLVGLASSYVEPIRKKVNGQMIEIPDGFGELKAVLRERKAKLR